MWVTVSCAGNYHPAHIFPRLERTEGRAGRPHPHRHRNYHPKTSTDEIYQNLPECGIFHRYGLFSWKSNHLHCKQGRHEVLQSDWKPTVSCVPRAAQSASRCNWTSCMRSTRTSAACAMAANPWADLPHPTPEQLPLKKSGNPYVIARLFSTFA